MSPLPPFDGKWFATGDIAAVDANGRHRIVGRRSTDLIKSGGYRIGAGEIESALLTFPGVSEAAVRGLPDPDLGERIVAWAEGCGRAHPLVVRLVKGAYWDHEVVEAKQHGWESPVFEVKAESDRNFEGLTRRLLDARPAVRPAIASHNLRSVAAAVAVNRRTGVPDGDIEFQVLRGLGYDLQHALAAP